MRFFATLRMTMVVNGVFCKRLKRYKNSWIDAPLRLAPIPDPEATEA